MRKILNKILSVCVFFVVFQMINAQKKIVVNREVETTNDGSMLLGRQTKDQFLKEPYSTWYNEEYSTYAPDNETINLLRKARLNSHNIIVFLGTWCPDTHREFPRLMRVLDELKFPKEKLTLIAVNRKKESPAGEEGLYNIQKVPTIIVKKYGRELGRIVEFPISGFIEKDLLEITKKRDASLKDLMK